MENVKTYDVVWLGLLIAYISLQQRMHRIDDTNLFGEGRTHVIIAVAYLIGKRKLIELWSANVWLLCLILTIAIEMRLSNDAMNPLRS